MVKNPPANARDLRDMGFTAGWGRSLEEGTNNPLQDSCLENLMSRGVAGNSSQGGKESDTTEETWHAHTWRPPLMCTPR